MSASSLPPHVAPTDASRHGRAADALISSYLRELLVDDELGAPPAAEAMPLAVTAQPATERGLSGETASR